MLEDKRVCPHCRRDLHERPYLMARRASENVLSWTQVAWLIAVMLALLVVAS